MASPRTANSFVNSFMAGYSFIDDARSRQRQEKMLETRLAEEKEEREFRRTQATERAAREAELHKLNVENETTRRERVRLQDEAAALYATGDELSDEDVLKYAPHSPEIMAEMERRRRLGRITDASKVANSIGTQGTQQSVPGALGLTDQMVAGGGSKQPSSPEIAAESASETSQLLFEPSRGADSMDRVSEEDITLFDPEYQEKGLGARALDVVAGQIQQTTRAAGNLVDAVAQRQPAAVMAGKIPVPQAAGAAFGGATFVDSDFVTREEFAQITDPQERQAVRESNAKIIEAQRAKARDPSRNVLARPITRQGAVQEGGELIREEALRQEAIVAQRYEAFLSPEESPLDSLAADDPSAAAVQYFEDRATLESAMGKDYVKQVDARMVPVLDAYSQQISADISKTTPGTAQHRRQVARLENVQSSRNFIADAQPSVASQAGINSQGLKIGDVTRSNQVTQIAFDPNRPTRVPTTTPVSSINASLVVAGRIGTSTKRLNDRQIEALVTLSDEGLIDKQTMTTVLATGAWPAGKDPHAIKSMMAHGDFLYGVTEGGGVQIIASTKKGTNTDVLPSQEVTQEVINDIVAGAKMATPGMTPEAEASVGQFALQNAGYIRENFAVSSAEQRMLLGTILQESLFLARKNREENYGGWFEPDEKNAPTPQQVFMQPEVRRRLAQEFERPMIEVPSRIVEGEGIDWEAARQSIINGDLAEFGIMPDDARRMTDQQLAYVVLLSNGTPEQIEAAHAEARSE